jgi:hypothetical protein
MEAELPLIICDGLTISGSCNQQQMFAGSVFSDCNGESLSGVSTNIITNLGTYLLSGTTNSPFAIGNCFPSFYPYVGGVYSVTLEVPAGYELCDTLSGLYDRLDFVVTQYTGVIPGVGESWSGITNHYLNDVLVFSDPDQVIVSNIGAEFACQTLLLPAGEGTVFNFSIKKSLISPTPTPTNTRTPTLTPTLTPTNTQTPTQTSTLGTTPTQTPTPSTTPAIQIFTHGTVLATCSDFCNANYQIDVSTPADANFGALTIGDTIYNQGGVAGFVAYAATSTDTATGTFRIAQIDTSGEILAIYICIAGNCEVL